MANPFQSLLNLIYKKFSDNPAKMLVATGCIGWILSSGAQVIALMTNDKISAKEKSFLIPQELADAGMNIATFLLITQSVQKFSSRLFRTGKYAPKAVREFLNKNYKNEVGKIDFDLDKIFKGSNDAVAKKYTTCKNFYTTLATLGASILSTNIITPFLRNKTASRTQKFINENYNDVLTVHDETMNKKTVNKQNTFKGIANPYSYSSGNLKI